MGERRWQVGKRVGAAAIVVAAGVTLGLSVHHDVQFTANVTTSQWIATQNAAMRQEECIYNAIRAQVPKGATVYVNSADWAHAQRLYELSTLWAVPQASPATAQWTLSLVSAHGGCSGLALKVTRI
jgi:hypothetical protein